VPRDSRDGPEERPRTACRTRASRAPCTVDCCRGAIRRDALQGGDACVYVCRLAHLPLVLGALRYSRDRGVSHFDRSVVSLVARLSQCLHCGLPAAAALLESCRGPTHSACSMSIAARVSCGEILSFNHGRRHRAVLVSLFERPERTNRGTEYHRIDRTPQRVCWCWYHPNPCGERRLAGSFGVPGM
jgi:hypothetical protein